MEEKKRKVFVTKENTCAHCGCQFGDNIPDICPSCDSRLLIELSVFNLNQILGSMPLAEAPTDSSDSHASAFGNRCANCGGYLEDGICGRCGYNLPEFDF